MRRLAALLLLVSASTAQGRRPPGPGLVEPTTGERIQWFGTWKAALEEANRTNRPILLVSAAPHCHNISGVW